MNPFEAPLHIALLPSRRIAGGVAVGHVLALGLAALGVPTLAMKLLFLAAILASLADYQRHHYRLHRDFSALLLHADGALSILSRAAGPQPARLASQRLITPWLTVLVVETGRRRLHVALAVDNTAPEQFRRLRVRLNHPPPAAFNR